MDFASKLVGMFSFVLWDKEKSLVCAFRDHIGITPLYVGWGSDGCTWFTSEMKAFPEDCASFKQFPPGHYYSSATGKFVRWYRPQFVERSDIPTLPCDLSVVREGFTEAVRRRMMSDVPDRKSVV